jgi:hypothetical protein
MCLQCHRQRYIGPFEISPKISSQAYRLRFPFSMQRHVVFHISRLKKCHSRDSPPDIAPRRIAPPHDGFIVDSILDFRISHIAGHGRRGPTLAFLTHLDGLDSTHD